MRVVYQPCLHEHKETSTVESDVRRYIMNTRLIRAFALAATFTSPLYVKAADYFTSPAEGIMCTIRDNDAVGVHEAVGTDMRSNERLFMEIIRVSQNASQSYTFSVDRSDLSSGWSPDGGYDVFRRNCAPILSIIPDELKGKFTNVFSTKNASAPAE